MKFKIIACINNNNVLGRDNDLLYTIKNDLANFKRITNGGVVIMGKKTWESLPKKPLPNRHNIVITRDVTYCAEGAIVVHSIKEAVALCADSFSHLPCYVIGGGMLYQSFLELDLVDVMYITKVNDSQDGDTYFPMIDETWRLFYQSAEQHDDITNMSYNFSIYQKKIC